MPNGKNGNLYSNHEMDIKREDKMRLSYIPTFTFLHIYKSDL